MNRQSEEQTVTPPTGTGVAGGIGAVTVRPAVFVRLSPDQYRRLASDALILGKSPPEAMREAYFLGPPASPVISNEALRPLMVELARIGNNVNQIARRVNTGSRPEAAAAVLKEFVEEISALRLFFSGAASKPAKEA